ncbi:MAG: hypothetical protein PHO26_00715 [Dehalococcoidia bacterium]|nr:hypothetical protein [Dehalococcoidia bacterium]MDD5494303.1 hypothetical protein [Dehalococcoidia bacterium]
MNPQLEEFIIFCLKRNGREWPSIYDEMANVAGRRLFKGMGHSELKQLGLSLSLSNIDKLKRQVEQIISERDEL